MREQEIAIEIKEVSKTFKVPHEKHTTLKATALNAFKKKRYSEFQALKDVTFKVNKGEFFGIIGKNGCGKSTLLKIIAGIYVPTEGGVSIRGKISPFLELGVGFNPELTARENVFLGGAILGIPKKRIEEKFDDIIRFSELEEFVDMKFKNYSSGMQVRLAFSLAINAHAEILLMDEVLAVGDANFQEKCFKEFRRFKKEGRTILFVTHSMDMVEKFCDRALLIDKGRIKLIGSSEKVANAYTLLNALEKEKNLNKGDGGKERLGDGSARIRKIWMEDSQGKIKGAFDQGSNKLLIFTKIKFNKKIKNPVFGIGIRNSSEHDIFVTNSLWEKTKTGIFEKNQEIIVKYEIENCLAPGEYTISAAIADSEAENFFDRGSCHIFSIRATKKIAGIVSPKHIITVLNGSGNNKEH